MLKAIRIDNFKSLIELQLSPVGVNLFVGANNAGKTNICQALQFLSLTSRMPLQQAAEASTLEAWNLSNVYLNKTTIGFEVSAELKLGGNPLQFNYELTIVAPKGGRAAGMPAALSVESEVLRLSGDGFDGTTLMENKKGHVKLLHERRYLKKLSAGSEDLYVDTGAPAESTMLNRLYDLETNQRANIFKRYLSSWSYYNLIPGRLRSAKARPMEVLLESSGGNLASVMFNLHNAKPRIERKLIEALRSVEPHLELFSYQSPDPEHVYMFLEDKKGNSFRLENVSDGTLRYLAICFLVMAAPDLTESLGGPPLVMLEEPENGIFVGYLKGLFENIEPSGARGQFLFTSHSPYFIDLFDGNLDGIFVVKAGETHSSLTKPEPATLQERLGEFSLGELHFKGLIS